ncbi:MAG: alpha/beta hydrolase [Oscillospiraceae bacterium]|nr:alpha/beta hydrolase [Oscillospiraceae bacterium]
MGLVLKILKIVGIILLILVVLIAALLICLSMKPFVPDNYTKTVGTGGEIEAKYLTMGAHEVKYAEAEAPGDWKKFEAFYPADLETEANTYPVVVFANGTGVFASKYKALFRHLASWGFIVLGNEDPSTCTGASAEATLTWLLEQNGDPDSVFYQKVDTEHIGISGHSQGGVAVFNAVSEQPHGGLYTCAVSLSPTEWALAMAIGLDYDPGKMTTPTLILATPENDVITPDGVKGLADAIPAGTVRALRPGMDHGRMLYSADGYVTAWFMWQLQGDQDAAKAFVGESPEILNNPMYQNVAVDLE